MNPEISACMIVKNAAGTVEAALKSIRPHVDELVIVDTGSTDGTTEICRRHADKVEVFLDCNDPESGLIDDFSLARNRSLELASKEWMVWLDADDVVKGAENLRAICRKYTADAVQVLCPYEYDHDAQGVCTTLQYRERIVRPRDKFDWRFPIHEGLLLSAAPEGTYETPLDDSVLFVHREREGTREAGRNLRILKKWVEKVGETVPRAIYYLGKEMGMAGDTASAFYFLERFTHIALDKDEKCLAHLALSQLSRSTGDHNRAIAHAQDAMMTRGWPEPYFALAESFYAFASSGKDARHNYERAAHFIEIGLALKTNDAAHTVQLQNPKVRYLIHNILNVCLSRIGNLEGAMQSCELGIAGLHPDDPVRQSLQRNLDVLRKEHSKRSVHVHLDTLVEKDELSGASAKMVKEILDGSVSVQLLAAPVDMPVDGTGGSHLLGGLTVAGAAADTLAEGKLDLVFFLGQGLEPWNPDTFAKTGLGGSETMAWELSRRLARLGHRVRLYGHCKPSQEGVFDGVQFLDGAKFRNVKCDVLITSRRPEAVDDEHGCKAGARMLWVHDIHCGPMLTRERDMRLDAIFALSKWHKDTLCRLYETLDPEKVIITRNGIDPERFAASETRDPHRAIYSSSPDRGLQTAVDVWPEIRKQVPDATLHVFYGFFNWEQSAHLMPDKQRDEQLRSIRYLKQLCASTEGVVMHERVNQKQLAREFMKSGVWAYPTFFPETSCCHPDTRISVPGDHRGGPPAVRIVDMVGQSGFPVYAFNEELNRFELATVKRVWQTKIARELVAVRLDDGQLLRLTPEHRVLTFDGDWVEAGSLQPGDSLRALHYRYNVAIRDGNGRWTDEHRLVGAWKEGRALRRDEHVDHSDLQRLDNRPEALTVMTAAAHFSKTHRGRKQSRRGQAARVLAWHKYWASFTPEQKSAHGSRAGHGAWKSVKARPDYQQWLSARSEKRKATIAARMADPVYAAQALQHAREAGRKGLDARWGKNHKVVSVERIYGETPVYDMEVDGLHNFVADGIVIHNCVTAMEAQAAGCRVVTTPIAALNETVGERGVLIPGNWDDPSYWRSEEFKADFVREVVDAMLRPRTGWEMAEAPVQADARFSLDSLATDWDKLLTELHANVVASVVPKFSHREVA